jgi:hypothetical protein
METVSDISVFSAVMAGICLSAAAGLRVFIPILALGLAARFEWLPISEQFMWMASEPVLVIIGIAALLEAGSYYIPIVDNLLDILATPAALAGGTVIVSSLLPEMNATAQWATAALLGGGSAGVVQGSTVLARGMSTASTGGLGNPLLSTTETGGSLVAVILALLIPVAFGLFVLLMIVLLIVWLFGRGRQHNTPSEPGRPS